MVTKLKKQNNEICNVQMKLLWIKN